MHKEYLVSLMEKANFNQEFFDITLKTFEDLCKKDALQNLLDVVSDYEKGELEFFAAAEKIDEIAKQTGICVHYVYTVYFAFMAEVLRKRYLEKGYPLQMWQEFIYDLNYQALYFKNKAGIFGLEGPLWQSRFFNYTIFGFGILQFEIRNFGDYYKNGNLEISLNTPVIFVHIPNTGKPLDYQAIKIAYAQAEKFFTENYLTELGGKVVFTFRSWVASKCFEDLLKPTSNIRLMMQDYLVFKYGKYDDNDADTISRIYGGQFEQVKDYSVLPETTSMARGVKALLTSGKNVGWGWGIYKPHVDRYK